MRDSLSPVMHNAAFEHLNMDWAYLAFEVQPDLLGGAVNAVRALGLAGVNVTMPYKSAVIDFLDELDSSAADIQSVNTIVNTESYLKGYSTDGDGFRQALRDKNIKAAGRHVLIAGAGGAARAIAKTLVDDGAESISIMARKEASLRNIIDMAKPSGVSVSYVRWAETAAALLNRHDMIINATPLGKTTIEEFKFLVDGLKPGHIVADLSTVPPLTALLVAAQERGCTVISGLGMLVHQGSDSFELWTGQAAPVNAMKRAVGEGI